MGFFQRIMDMGDLEEIIHYEKQKLKDQIFDPTEREIFSWNARWRQESLEHYVPLGWSYIIRDPDIESTFSEEGGIVGYFLAQPLLFVDGQPQSLWVEHVSYSSLKARDELCEVAFKLSREKHFQKVLYPKQSGVANSISGYNPERWPSEVLSVKTTKA